MKTIINFLIVFCICVTSYTNAQEFSIKISGERGAKLKIENINAKLIIDTHNGQELKITAEGYTPPPSKAEGLSILRRNGLENTSIGLVINEIDDMVVVSGGNKTSTDLSYKFLVPQNMAVSINNNKFSFHSTISDYSLGKLFVTEALEQAYVIESEDEKGVKKQKEYMIVIKNVNKEIEIDLIAGSFQLENITGPVVAKTGHGNINIIFSELNQESPMSFISRVGDIDIYFPPEAKGNFKLYAGGGEIYTNLKFQMEDWKEKSKSKPGVNVNIPRYRYARTMSEPLIVKRGSNLAFSYVDIMGINYDFKGTLNGGGVEITIRSQNGDIFLRKAK